MPQIDRQSVVTSLLEHSLDRKKVAAALHVRPRTLQEFLEKNPQCLHMASKLFNDGLVQQAQQVVTSAVTNGDVNTAKWVLERQGGDMGWDPKQTLVLDGKVGVDNVDMSKLSPEQVHALSAALNQLVSDEELSEYVAELDEG